MITRLDRADICLVCSIVLVLNIFIDDRIIAELICTERQRLCICIIICSENIYLSVMVTCNTEHTGNRFVLIQQIFRYLYGNRDLFTRFCQ